MRALALSFVLAVSAPGVAGAQLIPQGPDAHPSVIAGLYLEPELVLDVGYVQPFPAAKPGLSIAIAGTMSFLVLVPPDPEIRGALIALASLGTDRWRASCALDLSLTHFDDDVASMWSLGTGLRCQPAHVLRNWALGLDLGFQSALSTHIEHTARARRAFDERYPDPAQASNGPQAGWYAFGSQRVRLGLSAQLAWSEYGAVALALGTLFALQQQGVYFSFSLAHVPFYLEIALRFGW
ncbi:MAG TPA: hypothetical protein VJV78_03520 [Polyangiales bacterium]|nr:hypothetical protein [Polyangiales bacterium]